MKYALRVGIPLIVAAALVLGFAVPALAKGNDDKNPKPAPALRTVQGTVVQIASDNSSFKVQNASGNVSVSVNATTKYYVVPVGKNGNGRGNKNGQREREDNKNNGNDNSRSARTPFDLSGIPANWVDNPGWLKSLKNGHFSDITVGGRVVVRMGAGDNVARQVLIIGVKAPVIERVKGTLSNVTGTSLTITPAVGSAVILKWDSNTRFTLKGLITVAGGKYASAVYNKDTMKALTVNVLPVAPAP